MTVLLTLSATSSGSSLPDTTDFGSLSAASSTSHQDVFISHDAVVASITDCAIYIQRYTGSSYLGDDADADLVQLLGWGDAGTGGVKMSMTPDVGWVVGNEFTSGWITFKNGVGDVNNQIPLDKDSIVVGTPPAADGSIPVNGESHIQIKVTAPPSPGSAGYKGFGLIFAYSATS